MNVILMEIEDVLRKMSYILSVRGFDDWGSAFQKMGDFIHTDSDDTITDILSMYRGTGSLTDIVFTEAGTLSVRENMEFDALRQTLRELCWEYRRTKAKGERVDVKKKSVCSLIGLIVALLALAFIFVEEDIAKSIYPDPPPSPLFTRKDMSPIEEGEMKDAVVEFAADIASSSSRKLADATVETGKKTARGLWDKVKGLAGEEAPAEGDTADADGKTVSEARNAGEEAGTAVKEPKQAETPGAAVSAPAIPDSEKKEGLSWRDVKINIGSSVPAEQKRLRELFGKATVLGGLAALALAMAGWIRREDQRICICAGIAGVLAMAWVYLMTAIAIAIVAVILGPVISAFN